ncbi:hypothetical protein [Sorangium sp. So ce233]
MAPALRCKRRCPREARVGERDLADEGGVLVSLRSWFIGQAK